MSLSHLILAFFLLTLAVVVGRTVGQDAHASGNDARAQRFVQQHEAKIRPLEIESAKSWWLSVGRFMRQRVFEPGCTLDWNQLTRHATGAELNARAFAEDLKD